MMKRKQWIAGLLTATLLLSGCANSYEEKIKIVPTQAEYNEEIYKGLAFSYQVVPETFEVIVESNGIKESVSLPQQVREVSDYKEEDGKVSWRYPKEEIEVVIEQKEDYLGVTMTSYKEGENSISWPKVAGENYMIPLREGKYIPKDDAYWKDYLNDMEIDMMETLSMGFFGVNHEDYNILYIADDLFHSEMQFNTIETIGFGVEHTYTSITKDKSYGYRIYVTPNEPVYLAKLYKQYQVAQGKFKTLEAKAEEQPNIRKLYGASHMYLWDKAVIAEENINWQALQQLDIKALIQKLDKESMTWLTKMLTTTETGSSMQEVLKQVVEQDYIDNYQKSVVCLFLSELLLRPDFYEANVFNAQDSRMKALIEKGVGNLNESEMIELNKHALQQSMPEVFAPVQEWTYSRGVEFLEEMKAEGIDKLWIGLDHWAQGLANPNLVDYAVEAGYLIGPYDSYHSIHEPGQEAWHTATFEDTNLYEEATISNKEGKYEKGFQGVGRKLNPTLSLEAVNQRVKRLMANGVNFNTWFVDCDATGEIYDDYTEGHITTKEEDLQARLDRMALIRDQYGMVMGSEGGNDFASTTIALAHGIELPSFSWMDEDMKANKESAYYLGRWYSPKGGVPEKFSKPVPVKEAYKKIFLDPVYSIPLFKLVYNDSLITTYHWDWSTFKIQDEVENRMLYEILYNVPPMYHLDKWEWDKYKESIVRHSNFYEDFSEQAILLPMTSFEVLTSDRLVQSTTFGETLQVVANFKDQPYTYDKDVLEPHSLIVYDGEEKYIYQP